MEVMQETNCSGLNVRVSKAKVAACWIMARRCGGKVFLFSHVSLEVRIWQERLPFLASAAKRSIFAWTCGCSGT